MAQRKRVHILSAVNAGAVTKTPTGYRIADVCGAVDGIVMNGMLYPGDQLAAGAASLEGKPAPAGHPKDDKGRHISALSGNALLSSYAGAVCVNARHDAGRTLVDVVVNAAQAKAHPDGAKLVERLDAALDGTNAEPIHVSTGLYCKAITANGESLGKKYRAIATDIEYDHLAFLLHQSGAATPEQLVGMFLNADGQEEEVEVWNVADAEDDAADVPKAVLWLKKAIALHEKHMAGTAPTTGKEGKESQQLMMDQMRKALAALGGGDDDKAMKMNTADRRTKGLGMWLNRLLMRVASELSFDQIREGSVAFSGTAQEMREKREYEPVSNRQEGDQMKDMLIAALNAAGIKTEGLDDAKLLAAYNAHVGAAAVAPVKTQLDAANAQLQTLQANAEAADKAELATLAAELAANSQGTLTAADFTAMGLARCRELKANGKAAPVVTGNAAPGGGDEFAAYDPNQHFDAMKEGK